MASFERWKDVAMIRPAVNVIRFESMLTSQQSLPLSNRTRRQTGDS